MARDMRWGRDAGPCRGLKHSGPEAGSPATGAPGAPTRATACRHMSVMWPIPAYSRMSRIPATADALSGKAREVAITAPSGPVILNLKFESSSLKSSNIPAMGLLPVGPLSPALVLVARMTARHWAAIQTGLTDAKDFNRGHVGPHTSLRQRYAAYQLLVSRTFPITSDGCQRDAGPCSAGRLGIRPKFGTDPRVLWSDDALDRTSARAFGQGSEGE
jgi:hypothetical protein